MKTARLTVVPQAPESNAKLKLIVNHDRGPSERFLALTRNPELESPLRFEPTVKRMGDVVI